MTKGDETGWLLERTDGTSILYHSLIVGHPWETTDHLKALRFARKEDADAYIAAGFVGEEEYRAVEHMWCALAAPATEAMVERVAKAIMECDAAGNIHWTAAKVVARAALSAMGVGR